MVYLDPVWLLFAIIPFIITIIAQLRIKSTYSKYSKIPNKQGITGLDASKVLLEQLGLNDVSITIIPGQMTDHYDPSSNTLGLSAGTANTASVASIGIAAHELGHALQDKTGYSFMKFRSALVPVANLGTKLGYILFVLGLVMAFTGLVWVGIILFSFATLFTLITLPVEFNASSRALSMIRESKLLDESEIGGAKSVLQAAALTYLAAALQSIMNLVYLVSRAR